jgi:hypothetical protein
MDADLELLRAEMGHMVAVAELARVAGTLGR